MTWPAGLVSTANLDSGTADSPSAARVQLLEVVEKVNLMIDHGEPLSAGRLIGVQVFNVAGTYTYTPTADTTRVIVEAQAAGGGGGGSAAAAAGSVSVGQGGYSGAYAKALLTTGFAGVSIIVGAKGAGGLGVANGVGGGLTDFGGIVIVGGGPGGRTHFASASAPVVVAIGTAAPTAFVSGAATPLVLVAGRLGAPGMVLASVVAIPGSGADSPHGSGSFLALISVSGGPPAATGRGSGGGGALTMAGGAAQRGADASDGCVIVWEFA